MSFCRRAQRTPELPAKLDVEVREEIRFYLEMRARELMEEGLAPDVAWRMALDDAGSRADRTGA